MKAAPMYIRTRGNQGPELRRKGATAHCTAFAGYRICPAS
jgi:hypothetical protein